MDTTFINLAQAKGGSLDLSVLMLALLLAGWLIDKFFKYRALMKNGDTQKIDSTRPTWKEVNHQLAKKVNGDSCKEFRTRIGDESIEHRKNIEGIKTCLSDIKGNVEYIKGKIE